jgi:hypothetical protein
VVERRAGDEGVAREMGRITWLLVFGFERRTQQYTEETSAVTRFKPTKTR